MARKFYDFGSSRRVVVGWSVVVFGKITDKETSPSSPLVDRERVEEFISITSWDIKETTVKNKEEEKNTEKVIDLKQ